MEPLRMIRDGMVSTIIPVYNRPDMLSDAVQSVLSQTYRPIEIIIVDDGSSDTTPDVAASYVSTYPEFIRFVQIKNSGPGIARETGRVCATGEFIQYLDSDDLLLPRKFESQVSGLRDHSECDVAYGITTFLQVEERHEITPWKRTGERIPTMFPSMLQSRWWGTSTPLYRRLLLEEVGPWLPLRTEEDWEYDCRVARRAVRLFFCDCVVSQEREHSGPRLSIGGSSEPDKLRDRAKAHRLILTHAQSAGVGFETREMQHFARELFLLSRQCGAAGLAEEARSLFDLSRVASGSDRAKGLDFRLYHALASIVGWSFAGTLARFTDRLR
jgi:glycosyltransferase involved in cell wall biosynthesis